MSRDFAASARISGRERPVAVIVAPVMGRDPAVKVDAECLERLFPPGAADPAVAAADPLRQQPGAAASRGACRSRPDLAVTGSGHGIASSGSSNAIETSSDGSCVRLIR